MTTIYTVQNASPKNEVRDMSVNQTFSCNVDGMRCTDYQIKVYKVSDNTELLDTTKLALTPYLSDGELLEHIITGGTIPNSATESYKWTIEVWNDTENVLSREFQFIGKTEPILTFSVASPITTQSYTFTGSIAQAEGDIVNNYTFELYDLNYNLIETSGKITSFNISHEFDGFTNGDDLYIKLNGITTGGQTFESDFESFNVAYSSPSIEMTPLAEVDNYTSLIEVSRGEVEQIIGVVTGDSEFVEDFIYEGNNALQLDNDTTYVEFEVDIPIHFTLKFKWKPLNNDFEGKIVQLDDGAYEVGYESGRFYYEINGTRLYSEYIDIYGSVFYIILLPQKAVFNKTGFFTQLNSFAGTILSDLTGTTLGEIGLL